MCVWAVEAAPHRSLVNNPKSVCECEWIRIHVHISNYMKKEEGTEIASRIFQLNTSGPVTN